MEMALLADVPPEEARQILAIARRRTFARGEILFHADDPGDALHLIQKGRVAVRTRTPLGEDALVAILGRGDAVGELALVSTGRRTATAYALEATETLCVLRDEFERLRSRHAGVDRMLVKILARELARMTQLLTDAYYVSAERRVRRRLLDLIDVYGTTDGETVVPLTQEQLASLAGTSRATVNAVLAVERERGAVELRRGATVIRDGPGLARRAGLSRHGT
jgi:CRP/FNR family transcriptional regulator, cyclic AMP receptor protein